MEENSNLTAERSLEIITKQLEQSRKSVSKTTGQSLYIAGLWTMGIAIFGVILDLLVIPHGHGADVDVIFWLVVPISIWLVMRKYQRCENAPTSLVGTLVLKTWTAFAIITFVITLAGMIWNVVILIHSISTDNIAAYLAHRAAIAPIFILLMGMAVAISGYILKNKRLVRFGIIASLTIAVCNMVGIGQFIVARFVSSPETMVRVTSIFPNLYILLFTVFGLTIPGYMLKKQSL